MIQPGLGSAARTMAFALATAFAWTAVAHARPVATAPPVFAASVYQARRAKLRAMLPPASVAVLFGKARMEDGERQDPNFLYLSGVEEAGAALLIRGGRRGSDTLFLAPRDPEVEAWDGVRESVGRALRAQLGFPRIKRTPALGATLAKLASRPRAMLVLRPVAAPDAPVPPEVALYRSLAERAPWMRVEPLVHALARLRAVKDEHEQARIRQASELTVDAHLAAWRATAPGKTEAQVKAELEAVMRKGGARRVAYASIVVAGARATTLHGQRDDGVLKAGELVLIDAGAEIDGYATDVTRTYPVSGRFTPEQRRIYDVVLAAQKAALAEVRPGRTLKDVHAAARKVLAAAGLADAFTHGTSHFVGLEVHDPGDTHRPLEAGNVLTVEPGVYLKDRALGIRIEDTVVVTPQGHENLSARLPREAVEIERAMSAGAR